MGLTEKYMVFKNMISREWCVFNSPRTAPPY